MEMRRYKGCGDGYARDEMSGSGVNVNGEHHDGSRIGRASDRMGIISTVTVRRAGGGNILC